MTAKPKISNNRQTHHRVRHAAALTLVLGLIATTASAQNAVSPDPGQIRAELVRLQGDGAPAGHDLQQSRDLYRVYLATLYQPIWLDSQGLNPAGMDLLNHIQQSWRHGLHPENYHANTIVKALDSGTAAKLVEVELLLSQAFIRLAQDYQGGQLAPDSVSPLWTRAAQEIDPVELLIGNQATPSPSRVLEKLLPHAPEYWDLVRALEDHGREFSSQSVVAEGIPLQVGVSGPRISSVARRLQETGDYAGPPTSFYSDELRAAVQAFQARNGIEAEGLIGPRTVRALNRNPLDEVAIIVANLERWRWLPRDLGAAHIRVNVAGYQLEFREQGQTTFSSKVVVGKRYRQTPLLSSQVQRMVVNPYWYVPRRIALRDLLPKIKADPNYLSENGFVLKTGWEQDAEIVDPSTVDWANMQRSDFNYYLRQDPGERNALGQIKFLFANDFSVYIHDTANPELFSKTERAFSSGCIRIERPSKLAEILLLRQGDSGLQNVERALESGERLDIELARAMPVHLMYWTAWIDATGELNFRDDVYDLDGRLLRALNEFPSTPQWLAARENHAGRVDVAAACDTGLSESDGRTGIECR